MRRKLLVLDIVLVTFVVVVALRVHDRWLEARKREAVTLGRPLKQVPPPPLTPLAKVAPLTAAEYASVAQQMLLSADRNPTVIIERVAPPPMPALPVAYGVMNIGSGLMAIMAEKSGERHIAVHAGEKVGAFTLVRLTQQDLVLDWQGQQVIRKIDELRDHSASVQQQQNAGAQTPRTAPPPQAAPTAIVSVPTQSGPMGADIGGDYYACASGDKSPVGTVYNGHKKVSVSSPFGSMCKWAPAQ